MLPRKVISSIGTSPDLTAVNWSSALTGEIPINISTGVEL